MSKKCTGCNNEIKIMNKTMIGQGKLKDEGEICRPCFKKMCNLIGMSIFKAKNYTKVDIIDFVQNYEARLQESKIKKLDDKTTKLGKNANRHNEKNGATPQNKKLSKRKGCLLIFATFSFIFLFIMLLIPSDKESKKEKSHANFKLYDTTNNIVTERYENGYIKAKYPIDKNYQIHGEYQSWLDNDQKMSNCSYVHGKRHGLFTEYYNGNKFLTVNYVNGVKHGFGHTWHENGKKADEVKYVNGKREGPHTEWYSSGAKKNICNYKKDNKNGKAMGWFEGGNKRWQSKYLGDKENGLYISWHENGKMSKRVPFRNGKENGIGELWDKNGNLTFKARYKDGKNIGAVR